MNTTLLKKLGNIISAITNGDYSQGENLDKVLRDEDLSVDDTNFVESLGFMTVKLEVKEMSLNSTISDLQSKNRDLVELNEKRDLFSTMFVGLFLSISLYVFLLFIASAANYESEYAPRVVELIFFITCFVIVKKSKFPLTFFGFTRHGAMKSIKTMLPGTIVICVALVVVKYLCKKNGLNGLDGPLFYDKDFNMTDLLYLPVVVVQEFLARGVAQTVIEHVLVGRRAKIWSIITAAMLFGLVHIELSVSIALGSFLFGIYWGFIYLKSRTLIGVCISHFLIGYLTYCLGFWNYLLNI